MRKQEPMWLLTANHCRKMPKRELSQVIQWLQRMEVDTTELCTMVYTEQSKVMVYTLFSKNEQGERYMNLITQTIATEAFQIQLSEDPPWLRSMKEYGERIMVRIDGKGQEAQEEEAKATGDDVGRDAEGGVS